MKIGFATLFSSLLMLSATSGIAAQPSGQAPKKFTLTADSLRSSIEKNHPRLIGTNDRINKLKEKIKTDPTLQQYSQKIKAQADALLNQEPAKHELIGPRLLQQSRLAMTRVYILGLSYRLFDNKAYLDRLEKELLAVCNFPDWNPSHFLDTAEMTHAVAIGYDWFHDEWSPTTNETLRNAIINYGLTPGLELIERPKKRPHWVRTKNNWNQVCYGGLTLGALAIFDDNPQVATRTLNHAKNNLKFAMPEFAPDGGWIEGPGYWDYTTMYCFFLFAGLDTALHTSWDYTNTPGYKETGYFIPAMKGPTGQFFNWGDGSTTLGNLPQLFWMAEYFNDPFYAWLARDQMKSNPGPLDLLFYSDKGKSPTETDLKKDWWFKGINVASMRENWDSNQAAFIALKGGENAAPHSNLDLGAFVFDALGERWAIELGSENYNLPDYWNKEKRLAYYRLNSFGQNVLILDNKNQNPTASAKILRQASHPQAALTTVDISNAYSDQQTSVTRGFGLVGNRKQLLIQDDIVTPKPVDYQWQFHTRAQITIAPDGKSAGLRLNGKDLLAKVEAPEGYKLAAESAKQQAPQNTNDGVSKLVIKGQLPAGPSSIRVILTPGIEKPYSAPLLAVNKW